MSNKKQSRRVSSKKLRTLLTDFVNGLCEEQDKLTVSLAGNTFEIHLDNVSVDITINEKGGRHVRF
ncbi:MAG: hypothetical protein HDS60_03680 [Barnesiella sp.]|nr:hypothetical protein [Barnesiella sp.]